MFLLACITQWCTSPWLQFPVSSSSQNKAPHASYWQDFSREVACKGDWFSASARASLRKGQGVETRPSDHTASDSMNCTVSGVSRLATFFPPRDSTLFVGLLEFCLAPFVLLSHVLLLKVNFLVYTSIHFTIYLSSLGVPLFPFYAENTLWVSSKVGAAPSWLLHSSDPCYLYFNESQIPSVIKCVIILHTSEKAKIFPIKLWHNAF